VESDLGVAIQERSLHNEHCSALDNAETQLRACTSRFMRSTRHLERVRVRVRVRPASGHAARCTAFVGLLLLAGCSIYDSALLASGDEKVVQVPGGGSGSSASDGGESEATGAGSQLLGGSASVPASGGSGGRLGGSGGMSDAGGSAGLQSVGGTEEGGAPGGDAGANAGGLSAGTMGTGGNPTVRELATGKSATAPRASKPETKSRTGMTVTRRRVGARRAARCPSGGVWI
jgi:hypothetical protein